MIISRKSCFGVLFVCLLFAVACGGNQKERRISFMVFGDPAEHRAYVDLVDAFRSSYPAIEVELSHIPSPQAYRTRLATAFAAGSPPDVTLMNYRRYASFAAAGMLEPLGSRLDASSLIDRADFYTVALNGFVWRGELMCIPQNISSLVVYYNRDLFDGAGVPYPGDDWTWVTFLETAEALTRDADGDGVIDQYGLGVEPSLFRLAPFVWQNGAPLVDDLEHPTRLTLTRPPSLEALQWFVDLRQVHGVAPGRVAEMAQDSESRFIAGTTAMYLNSRRGTPTYRQIEAFSWDVAPLPRQETEAGVLHSDAYCLSSTAEDKDAAWTFIEFANSYEGQSVIVRSGRTVPSLKAVAESAAFLNDGLRPARSYVFVDNARIARRVPVISTWEEIEGTADREIERAFYGEISAEEAARLSFQRTEEYFQIADFASVPGD